MDLPSTPEATAKLNEEIAKYQAVYSEYIQCAVDMHNYHQEMIRKPLWSVGPRLRKHIKKMITLEKKLYWTSLDLCHAKQTLYKAKQRDKGRVWPTLKEKGQEIDYKDHGIIKNKKT